MDNPERVTYFAATDSRGKKVPFGLKAKDRSRHMYVIGKTGMGKSTLLENMAIQDIQNGEGLAFIDPHGSAVEKLLDYIPEHRKDDVIYFAPFDLDNPIAFNVMEDVGYDKRHLVVSGLMATFKKIWQDAWSARMEYILTNTLLALLEYPDSTLLGVNRMYTDKVYRKKVIENVKDPIVKDFWTKEFATYTDRYTQDATPAIQNKVGQFTGNPLIRNIIGQPKSSFDIRAVMDGKKILLINLSKGLVGDTNMRLLGSMLTTRIFLGAMSRAELAAHHLKHAAPFYFYVDEFQNFANETFAEILSEARKYNLNLIIAHQYVEQMEEEVRAAVFGNVGTTVAFRVGPFDAEVLETIFMPNFTKEDLINLHLFQVYLTLMIDGVGSPPFSATALPPIEPPKISYRADVIAHSQQVFGTPRKKVEEVIYAELAAAEAESGPVEPPAGGAGARPRRAPGTGGGNGSGNGGGSGDYASRPRTQNGNGSHGGNGANHANHASSAGDHGARPRRSEGERGSQSQAPRHDGPASQGKTAEDLRAILKNMSAAPTARPKQDVKDGNGANGGALKGALQDVLAKQELKPAAAPAPKAEPLQAPEVAAPASEKPAPHSAAPETSAASDSANGPYEVPEETLRALFSEPK